jgi:hypothetical protein
MSARRLRTALYHVHSLCRSARETAADSSLAEQGFLGELPVQDLSELSELIGRADAAFYYTLVSFLALYNFLGRLGDREEQEQKLKLQALRERGRDSFEVWLDSIESERSVTG